MNAFTLVAKLVFNTSSFTSSLAGVEKTMNSQTNKDRFSKWGVAMGNLASTAFQSAFTASSKFLKSVFETGMDFDEMMSDVYSISDATENKQIELRNTAIELGRTTKFTATEVGQAYHYMAMAGWEADEMLSAIAGVMDLAAASGEDLGTVSDIVTDSMTAFHIPIEGFTNGLENATHYANLLAEVAASANTNVGLMGETFKYVAPVAGAFGIQAEDIAVAVGTMANQGIKASQAGTSLRMMLLRLATNAGATKNSPGALDVVESLGVDFFTKGGNKEAVQAWANFLNEGLETGKLIQGENGEIKVDQFKLQSLGMAIDEMKQYESDFEILAKSASGNKVRDFLPFLRDLREQWKKIGDDDLRAYYGKQIAGTNAYTGLEALLGASDEEFEELVKQVESADTGEGAAHRMAETKLDNLKGDITLLNSALDGLKILISDEYKNDLRSFVTTFTEEIGKMSEAFQEGGLSGMLINLTDWIINGITDTLSDPEITVEGASKFGKALGDFVGHLVSTLLTNAPTILNGLFEAGVNLAGGIVEGMFAGLFGTGNGTVTGLIMGIQSEEHEAVEEANKTAVEAQGIVSYMDSLVAKYGEAATNTEEWASSLERLEGLIPGITSEIQKEGEALGTTTENLSAYIEQSRQKAIEDAKKAAVGRYREEYQQAQVALGTAEINKDIASYQMDEAVRMLADMIARSTEASYQRQREEINASDWYTAEEKARELQYLEEDWANDGFRNAEELFNAFKEGSLSFNELIHYAYAAADNLGESQDTVETLKKSYEESKRAYDDNTGSIKQLTRDASDLSVKLQLAEQAVERMVADMTAKTAAITGEEDSYPQAKGDWYVPYDNYPSLLHRGEMVLTASQARQLRDGGFGSLDIASLTNAIVGAVQQGLRDAQVNAYLNGRKVTDEVSRMQNYQLELAR